MSTTNTFPDLSTMPALYDSGEALSAEERLKTLEVQYDTLIAAIARLADSPLTPLTRLADIRQALKHAYRTPR